MRDFAPDGQSEERAPDTVIHGRRNIVFIDVRKSFLAYLGLFGVY